ncbi:hypothetical protein [Rhodobacter ferrooxidans]|uniref:Lipoprotein n=1 Tax=Rhodobacter ferrooxidans TaxID=371731 RepID=C8S3B5_9RHOB|nr:hypothetical protein [Rhodobacter sp. SW2]EEW24480.1 hypothetical protein Rsw2DRAFT_2543 [Rhodobacter sp. SW2]
MTAAAPVAILGLLALAGCVQPVASDIPDDCGCMRSATDAESIADTGFVEAAIYSYDGFGGTELPGGKILKRLRIDRAQVTPDQIRASPAAQCGSEDRKLVSSRLVPPGPDESEIPGSMIIETICK